MCLWRELAEKSFECMDWSILQMKIEIHVILINSSKKVLQFKFDWSYLSYYHIFFIIIGIIKKLV